MAAIDPKNAAAVASVKLNWHQWNWYREQGAPALPRYAPEEVGMTGQELITAAQYHEKRIAKGLKGFRPGYQLRRWA